MQLAKVVGQDKWKKRIVEEIRSEKVAHAQLFLGKLGHGSLALALAYAQYLFCEDKQETDACGKCTNCKRVGKGIHPDLHTVFPVYAVTNNSSEDFNNEWKTFCEDNIYADWDYWKKHLQAEGKQFSIGTKESTLLHRKLSLKSHDGGYKVLIVYKAEEMNGTFANKLLKLLEEPPSKTLILLVAEDPDRILPTIMSRTQIKKIGLIDQESIIPYIKEKGVAEDEAMSMCLRLNNDWGLLQKEIETGDAVLQQRELFIQLMRVCYKKNVLDMMNLADELADQPKAFQVNFLEYALNMFRQSLMKNYTGDMLFQASKAEADFLKNFARFITGNNVIEFMNLFSKSIAELHQSANARILFTRLTFKVMRYIHFA